MLPKYMQLIDSLMDLIYSNIENGINKLPTEKELCEQYGVSRQTVRLSLSILEEQGVLEKRRGSGSYITGHFNNPSLNTIGIIISNADEYIYPELLDDITSALSQHHFLYEVYVTLNSTYNEREILENILNSSIRGLIVEGCKSALPNPNIDLYQRLKKKGVFIVFVNNYYPQFTDCLYIKDDNLGGSALLIDRFIQEDHTAITGIFKNDDLQGIERYQGFIDTMKSFNIPIHDTDICWFDTQQLTALESKHDTTFLKAFIQNTISNYNAVLCYNNQIAYWLIKEMHNAGISTDDISIAAFDYSYLATFGSIRFTTLAHAPHEVGKKTAQTLLNQMKGVEQISLELPWKLMPFRK